MALSFYALVQFFGDEHSLIERGEKALKASHLQSFSYSGEIGVAKATVKASMKQKTYAVEVSVNDSGVPSGKCECPRGQYRCHHMASVMLHMVKNLTCTDTACTWKQKGQTSAEKKSASEMFAGEKTNLSISLPDNFMDSFSERIKPLGSNVFLNFLLNTPEPKLEMNKLELMTIIKEAKASASDQNKDAHLKYVLEKLQVDQETIVSVATMTKGQSKNNLWCRLREGRITASLFSEVLSCYSEKSRKSRKLLVEQIVGNKRPKSTIASLEWGRTHESIALIAYCSEKKCDVSVTGLWLHSSGIIGASPDGLIGDDGILEIKCPFSARNSSVMTLVESDKFYICKDSSGCFCFRENNATALKYYHQIQGQMYVTNRKFCDFFVWSPADSVTLRIKRDDSWCMFVPLLEDFFENEVLPSLIE